MAEPNVTGTQVHAVSSGEYSDYGVLCVCPTKADAEAVAKKVGDDAFVETFAVVTGDVEQVDMLHLSTTLWDDGTETDTGEWVTTDWPFSRWQFSGPVTWRWVRAPMHKGKGGRLDVNGSDHKRVRKVYSDRRAKLLASDAARLRTEAQGRR